MVKYGFLHTLDNCAYLLFWQQLFCDGLSLFISLFRGSSAFKLAPQGKHSLTWRSELPFGTKLLLVSFFVFGEIFQFCFFQWVCCYLSKWKTVLFFLSLVQKHPSGTDKVACQACEGDKHDYSLQLLLATGTGAATLDSARLQGQESFGGQEAMG